MVYRFPRHPRERWRAKGKRVPRVTFPERGDFYLFSAFIGAFEKLTSSDQCMAYIHVPKSEPLCGFFPGLLSQCIFCDLSETNGWEKKIQELARTTWPETHRPRARMRPRALTLGKTKTTLMGNECSDNCLNPPPWVQFRHHPAGWKKNIYS